MKKTFLFILLVCSFGSVNALMGDSIPADSVKKNGIGGDLGGYSLGIGATYERLLINGNSVRLHIGMGVGFDVLSLHWVSIPAYTNLEFGNSKVRPLISVSAILGIGNDLTYGYSDPETYFAQECGNVPCAPWHPKVVFHYMGGAGIRWFIKPNLSISARYNPTLLYHYYQTVSDNRELRFYHLGGVTLLKHF